MSLWMASHQGVQLQLSGPVYFVGISLWKRASVRPFLSAPLMKIHFVSSLKKLSRLDLLPDAKILIWGSQQVAEAQALAKAKGVPLWRMEDGFIRSVGLGSDLYRPLSLVVDTSGMYYDPHSGSDLERYLQDTVWGSQQLEQAQQYIADFVSQGVSKYNLGGGDLNLPKMDKTIILVPGQVEDDASVKFGSPVVRTNAELIQVVRRHNPHAYILYKPHPDVVVGNRQGSVAAEILENCVDQVVTEASIVSCLQAVDQVHTMTSLTGFEALLHGKEVHCYGGPFYAGWGLTVDHYDLPHRQRLLNLDQLVYATIFQYPRYVLPPESGVTGVAEPEAVMKWLAQQAAQHKPSRGMIGWLKRKQRKVHALWQLFFSRCS